MNKKKKKKQPIFTYYSSEETNKNYNDLKIPSGFVWMARLYKEKIKKEVTSER